MTRKITIDSDTSISYIYKDKLFEVENKGTITQRKATGTTEVEIRESAQNAFNVLQIVTEQQTPIDTTGKVVNVDRLVKLTKTDELLNALSYTYDNTGTYIKTIQFNDYVEYPLVLEAEKGKLYIMNTDFIYDLSLNIEPLRYVADICNFYESHLGLVLYNKTISDKNLEAKYLYPKVLYDLLTSYYTPNTRYSNTVNTTIQKDTQNDTLKYTNTIYSSNYKGEFPLSYTLTLNPNNKLIPDTTHEAHIIQLQENIITLTDTVPNYIHIGDTLQLTNVITIVNGTEYSADGNYTVTDIQDNTITVDRNFSTPYVYEPPTLNICGYKTSIHEISREDNSITLTGNVPDMYLIGDTITVEGTKAAINGQDYSLDGEYTISDVQGHKIIVEEQPLTNYPYGETEAPSTPYVYKTIQAGLIQDITNNVITLEANPIQTLTNSDPVYVRYQDSHVEYATATSIDENMGE